MKDFSLFLFMLLVRENMLMICMFVFTSVFGSGESVYVSLLMCTFLIVCVCVSSYVDGAT